MTATLTLSNLNDTHRLADLLAAEARPGLTVLLDGPVGAGKTTLARRTIQKLLASTGRMEDVPSPTFTIVQTYDAPDFEVWHADLYRLTHTSELVELGLDDAFETALCLVEWPDRLGQDAPGALRLDLRYGPTEDARLCLATATSDKAHAALGVLAGAFPQ